MINEEKVRLMTKIQIFRDTEQEAITATRYYRSDYIGLYLLRSLIAYVFLYLLLASVVLVYNWENILTTFDMEVLTTDAIWLLGSFLILLIPVMVASFVSYWFRYRKNHKKIREYEQNLKHLNNMYESE